MSLSKFLAEFQSTSPFAIMDGEAQAGGSRKYKYATYLSVVKALAPLAKKGVSWHHLVESEPENKLKITTVLQYNDEKMGAVILVDCPPNIQTMGSYITYLKRYQLSALTGLTTDEDDDGKTADDEQKAVVAATASSRARGTKPLAPTAKPEVPVSSTGSPLPDVAGLALASIRDADTSAKRQQILSILGVRLKEKKLTVKDYMDLAGKLAARTNDSHELTVILKPIIETLFNDFALDESQWAQLQSVYDQRVKSLAAAKKIGGTMKEEIPD